MSVNRNNEFSEEVMVLITSPTAEQAAEIVSNYFRASMGELEGMSAPLAVALRPELSAETLTTAKLDALVEPFAMRLLDMPDVPVYGAGFIAAIDMLADARSHLSWWQGDGRRKLVLAAQSVNKERIDYSELEWFRVPMTTGSTHVAGPYVDYLCSDEYTITIATPVYVNDAFVGVVAYDLLIEEVERRLTPRLDELGLDVTITNGVGRVVISTNPLHATGDFVREATASKRSQCGDLALDVIVTSRG